MQIELATEQTIIDVSGSKITLRFGEKEISYKMTPIPNLHKYLKRDDVKMDCEPVTPPTTLASSPEIEWFNMVSHIDPHDSKVEVASDSCKTMRRPGEEKFHYKKETQELIKVSHQVNDHRRKLKRFVFEERYPKKGRRMVKNNLAPIFEGEEFGECYKPFRDNVISTRKIGSFNHTHQPSNGSVLSQAPDDASERLHGLHLGLHHKYDFYVESSVNGGDLSF
ncbi:unnamed protein product [Linum trigynum]|uniref:Uncharacterized protein n=1 Tax=Linum trigynum TaxID=586398 RepID=A0AAV2G6C4_9ROSI